jgi:hypothetical protein
MSNCEHGAENNTNTADNNVGDAEEGIASSNDGSSRNDNGLGALVLKRREAYIEVRYACST